MNFINPDYPLSESKIAECETALGITFPRSLREWYLIANGGEPEPYVFENKDIDTVVSEFLPLDSKERGTAVQCYQRLVLGKKLLPAPFFPFAIDGGGDYFFTDTRSSNGAVYFYRSDSNASEKLLGLNLGLTAFWQTLKPE